MVNGRENESFKELSYQSHLSIGFITNCRLIYIITFNWLYCIQVSSFDRNHFDKTTHTHTRTQHTHTPTVLTKPLTQLTHARNTRKPPSESLDPSSLPHSVSVSLSPHSLSLSRSFFSDPWSFFSDPSVNPQSLSLSILLLWSLSQSSVSLSLDFSVLACNTHATPTHTTHTRTQTTDPETLWILLSLSRSLRPSFSVTLDLFSAPSVSPSILLPQPRSLLLPQSLDPSPVLPHLFSATPPSTSTIPFSPPGGGEETTGKGRIHQIRADFGIRRKGSLIFRVWAWVLILDCSFSAAVATPTTNSGDNIINIDNIVILAILSRYY